MKPVVKKKLAIFVPYGFLDGGNAECIIEPNDIEFLKTTKCEVVMVSLKKIIFFNKRGISTVLEALQIINKQIGAVIGFCDYDKKKYKMILDMYNGHVPFSMFDNESIALLFASSLNKEPSKCKILVGCDSKELNSKITIELYELGYKPVIAKDKNELNQKRDDFEYVIERSVLGVIDRAIRIHIKDNVVIYTLKDFLDSSLSENFDMSHHENALRIGFNNFLFDCKDVSSTNVHAINFLSKLSTAGAEYGATIAISGLSDKSVTGHFKNDLEDAGVLIYDELDDFFSCDEIFGSDGGGALSGSKPRHITKKLIEVLPLVLETTIKTIDAMTQDRLTRLNTKVQELKCENIDTRVCVSLAFYGQIEGIITLVFDEDVAKKACKALLSENSSRQELLNSSCELINIIGGKLIQQMARKDLHVDITMPRVYSSVKELINHKKGTKGVQVDFEIQGKTALLFLTR